MVQCVCVMWLFDKLLGGEFMPILASREKVMKSEVPMGKGEELIKDSGRESLPRCFGKLRRLFLDIPAYTNLIAIQPNLNLAENSINE